MGVAEKNFAGRRGRGSFSSVGVSAIAVCGVSLLAVGCANQRPPRPPTLRLPQPAHALTAERVGDTVTLHWTTRPKTTDGDAIRGAVTAVVCREDAPKPPPVVAVYPVPADPCREVARVTVVPGDSEARDVLPGRLTRGGPTLVAYRVQLLNARGHGIEASKPVYAVAGKAPAAAGAILTVPQRNAVVVKWQAVSGEKATMQVTRTLVATAAGPVALKAAKKDERALGGGSGPMVLVADGAVGGEDPGGMVDRTIHDGDTVTYTAQRVLTVRLALPTSPATEKEFVLRGEPSPVVTMTFHDVLPPGAPLGLVAVSGGGFGQAQGIDLSWEANAELDVAGYNVYRAGEGDSEFRKVNPALISGLAYRDVQVAAGKAYRYRVTAVDVRGHESEPGAPILARVKP